MSGKRTGRPPGTVPADVARELRAAATALARAEQAVEARRGKLADVVGRALDEGSIRAVAAVLDVSPSAVARMVGR